MKFSSSAFSLFLLTARSTAFGVPAVRPAQSLARRWLTSSPQTCPATSLMRGGAAFSTSTALNSAVATEAPVEIFRKDYTPLPFTTSQIEMNFDLQEGKTIVKTALTLSKNEGEGPLVLDGDETCVTLVSIQMDGKDLVKGTDYTLSPGKLTLLEPKDGAVLTTVVEIVPEDNTQLSGLYKSGPMYCTQCEALGFRRITYFPDRPDNMGSFTRVRLEGDRDKYPILLSNGDLIEKGDLENGRHFAVWKDPFPKPSYLFALVAGDLGSIKDTFTTRSGKEVHLEIFSEKENTNKLQYAMDSLKRSMQWDEDRFGLEYDLGIYNVVATKYVSVAHQYVTGHHHLTYFTAISTWEPWRTRG